MLSSRARCTDVNQSRGVGVAVALLGIVLASAGAVPPQDSAASRDTLSATQPPSSTRFGSTTKRVVIEVDYAPGAEPFTQPVAGVPDPWKIFRDNATAILNGNIEVVVPGKVAEMERL